jgi:hypothetical protein
MELGSVALIGVIVLGLAIAWGMYQNSRRDRRQDSRTEAVTRDLYDQGGDDTEPDRRASPR